MLLCTRDAKPTLRTSISCNRAETMLLLTLTSCMAGSCAASLLPGWPTPNAKNEA
jgi:hypothetical protein